MIYKSIVTELTIRSEFKKIAVPIFFYNKDIGQAHCFGRHYDVTTLKALFIF